jgi:hypothetical protein
MNWYVNACFFFVFVKELSNFFNRFIVTSVGGAKNDKNAYC